VSDKPNDQRGFVHKRILGGVVGLVTGGPTAAAAGFLRGGGSKGRPGSTRSADFGILPRKLSAFAGCPPHLVPVPGIPSGTACVPPDSPRARAHFGGGGGSGFAARSFGIGLPAGVPCILPFRRAPDGSCKIFIGDRPGPDGPVTGSGAPGTAVVGAFGLPAMEPDVVGTIMRRDGSSGPILRCGRGMVLGIDSLCYPKAVMPRRSKFRKWRAAPRPVISARDTKAIRIAASAKERVLVLAKDVGLHASKTRPAPRSKGHQHLLAAAPRALRVISEETN